MSGQLSFDDVGAPEPRPPAVPGLQYVDDYLGGDDELDCLQQIDAPDAPWITDLSRRVQHFGYRYDYQTRRATRDQLIGPLPEWVAQLCNRLHRDGLFTTTPDQVIVNEYLPGQGIAAHIDCVPCFGPVVATISLGSAWAMDFRDPSTKAHIPVMLERRSIAVLSGAARSTWTHGIAPRKSERVGGTKVLRTRRVSLTFRTMKFSS